MIPTLILFGLIFGRWWRAALIISAVGWPALLLTTDVTAADHTLLTASLLAIANTAAGVAVHQLIRRAVHRPT